MRPRVSIQMPEMRGGLARHPRVHAPAYLAFVRTLPCVVSGEFPVEAAHVRYGDALRGKRHTGAAEKPDDRWVVPLHPREHRDQHAHGEREWWAERRIDPLLVAALIFSAFHADDDIAARAVCMAAKNGFLCDPVPLS